MRGLRDSPSREVAVLFGVVRGDVRSTTGSNIAHIRRESGLSPLCSSMLQLKARLSETGATVPDGDQWRMQYLSRLLQERGEAFYEGEETLEWTELINSLVIN